MQGYFYWLKNKVIIKENSIFKEKFDLIISNEIETIPLAFKCFNKTKMLLDLHEYAPREFEDKISWTILHQKYVIHQCKKYFKSCDALTTVCTGIANEYKKIFDVNLEVITNAARYYDLRPPNVNENIKIIHHGAAISSRKIELMIEVFNHLDKRFTLDLMLTPVQKKYYDKLIDLVKDNGRVNIIPPVEMKDIIEKINKYDIGLFLLPPTNCNYDYALPNKLFEFIQARLAIAIGPSPEMSSIVKKYDLGIISKNFNAVEMAEALNSLTSEKIYYYKMQADKNAYILSQEENKKKLREIVFNLIGN
ncbi:MAG: capsular biosynthesis protein [Ignavibacteriae bacterium]|nr:capsular biosynthesis protein [Ignavibacteriota bacterium]